MPILLPFSSLLSSAFFFALSGFPTSSVRGSLSSGLIGFLPLLFSVSLASTCSSWLILSTSPFSSMGSLVGVLISDLMGRAGIFEPADDAGPSLPSLDLDFRRSSADSSSGLETGVGVADAVPFALRA